MAKGGLYSIGLEVIEDDDDLEEGDHVATEMEISGMKIHHHGIVVRGKKSLKVISFTSDAKKGGGTNIMHEQSLRDFADGSPILRVKYRAGQTLDPQRVAEKARQYLSNPWDFGEYHALKNNCEHFATLCKIGEKRSEQSETWTGWFKIALQYITTAGGKKSGWKSGN